MKPYTSTLQLKHLVDKKSGLQTILNEMIATAPSPFAILDSDGNHLLGAKLSSEKARIPIKLDDEIIGWVTESEFSAWVAHLIAHIATRERDRRDQRTEILQAYREINMFYRLAEMLTASLESASVAKTVLEEASHLFTSSGGGVILADETRQNVKTIASFGGAGIIPNELNPGTTLGDVLVSGKGEFTNTPQSSSRRTGFDLKVDALICAPLSYRTRTRMGLIFLFNREHITYRASDLKTLTALTALAAPAIETALLHEQALGAAQVREQLLQKQIEQLRLSLDEARRE
jgi:adenylate cyclase